MNGSNAIAPALRTTRNMLAGVLTTAVLSLAAAPASAHPVGDCVNMVVDSCNAQWPDNYPARIACVNSGITACEAHKHGGGGSANGAAIDPFFNARNRVDKAQVPVLIRR